jgi:predicted MFS family arabinose efflux permease
MRNTDNEMLARTSGISRLMAVGAAALGAAFGGLMVQEYGVRAALLALAALMVVLVLISLRMPLLCGIPQSGEAAPVPAAEGMRRPAR